MENNTPKLKFEFLVQKMLENITRITTESENIHKQFRNIKLKLFGYITLFIFLIAFVFTQFSSSFDTFLSKIWIEKFLINVLTASGIIILIVLIFMIYLKMFPINNDDDVTYELKENFLNNNVKIYSDFYSLYKRINDIINMTDIMNNTIVIVYTMFWMALCKTNDDKSYIQIKNTFLDDNNIPKSFKELFIEAEEELLTYNFENEEDIKVIVDYMNRDENILDVYHILNKQHLIIKEKLPKFIVIK